jgi:hypothetical protein
MLAEKRGIFLEQPSYEPPSRLKGSIHMNSQQSSPRGKPRDMEIKLSLGYHLRVQPSAKLAPATKLSSISRWIRWVDLKAVSSYRKVPGRGLWWSIMECMVVKDLRQPSTASPMFWARSWRSTIARRRRGSDQKLSTPSDDLSRAAIHSEIWWVSPTKSKQVPATIRSYWLVVTKQKGKMRKVARDFTSQQLTSRFNHTNEEGVALF